MTEETDQAQHCRQELQKWDDLPIAERREKLRAIFAACATATKSHDPRYLPLFSRDGVKDSTELQALITTIGVEYFDMLLIQLALQIDIDAATKKKEKDRTNFKVLNYLDELVLKEESAWNDAAVEALSNFPDQLSSYVSARAFANDNTAKNAENLMGSIINLVMRECVPQAVGEYPAEYDLDVPRSHTSEATAWLYRNALPQRRNTLLSTTFLEEITRSLVEEQKPTLLK